MFGLVGKGFCGSKERVRGGWKKGRLWGGGSKLSLTGAGAHATRGLFAFPVGRHCAIEIYVGGRTRAQSFAAEEGRARAWR